MILIASAKDPLGVALGGGLFVLLGGGLAVFNAFFPRIALKERGTRQFARLVGDEYALRFGVIAGLGFAAYGAFLVVTGCTGS
jgi:hypothetical protein